MGTNLETKVEKMGDKIQKIENENAVLKDKVESKEDPYTKPRIIRKGFVKKDIKFEKNNIIIPATISKEKSN